MQPVFKDDINAIAEEIYAPVRNYIEHKDKTTAEDVNPYYITPKMLQMRLQKTMDEYVAGCSTYYQTNGKLLAMGLHYLTMLKEDSKKMRAKDLHELMRAWENYHRIITAETHLRHIMFREETRYPGFYYRTDFPKLDPAKLAVLRELEDGPGDQGMDDDQASACRSGREALRRPEALRLALAGA